MALNDDLPMQMAHEAIYASVLKVLGSLPRRRILDLPAGRGSLAVRLAELGHDVVCGDLYPEIFAFEGIDVVQANMDARLPFDDKEFDIAVCVEGLEHVENPANAIREFARVIDTGGRLIISVPNIMNIEERLKWLLNGYTSHFKPVTDSHVEEMGKITDGRNEIGLHINPLGYAEVRYLLESAGFSVIDVHTDAQKGGSIAFAPLVWAIRGIGRLSSASRRSERWTDEMNSPNVLNGGNTLIFEARKQ